MSLTTTDNPIVRTWYIYKITNPSGNYYIGKTFDFKTRLSHYKSIKHAIRRQRIILNSLCKYGFDAHLFEVIDSFTSTEEYAFGKEMFWIRSYMSNVNKWRDGRGMNLTDGGQGAIGARFHNRVSPFKGKRHSDETKQALSQHFKLNPSNSFLGRTHSDATKKIMSENKKGQESHFKGKRHTEESRQIMSLKNKGRVPKHKGKSIWNDENRKRIGISKVGNTYNKGKKLSDDVKDKMKASAIKYSKPILCFTLNGDFIGEYMSKRGAAKELNVSRSAINEILNGTTKNPKSFIFKYKQSGIK